MIPMYYYFIIINYYYLKMAKKTKNTKTEQKKIKTTKQKTTEQKKQKIEEQKIKKQKAEKEKTKIKVHGNKISIGEIHFIYNNNTNNDNIFYNNEDNVIETNNPKLLEIKKSEKINEKLVENFLYYVNDNQKRFGDNMKYLLRKKDESNDKNKNNEEKISDSSKTKSLNNEKPKTKSLNDNSPTSSIKYSSDTEYLKQDADEKARDFLEAKNEYDKKIESKMEDKLKKKFESEKRVYGPETQRIEYEVENVIKKIEKNKRRREERKRGRSKETIVCAKCKEKFHPHSINYHMFINHDGFNLSQRSIQACFDRFVKKRLFRVNSLIQDVIKQKNKYKTEINNAKFINLAKLFGD